MRRKHFETFKPVCPVCRTAPDQFSPLAIAAVIKEDDDHILEGLLHCSNSGCQREYPIVDGIPLIIKDIRAYVRDNAFQIFQRSDLSEVIESALGDCLGHGSTFDAIRQHLSSYAWDHYGDLDPNEPRVDTDSGNPRPGTMIRVLERGLELSEIEPGNLGSILDIGCSVGRSTFALAEKLQSPVLGVDLNFPMLRLAGRVLREGIVRYPRRRVGIVYDRHKFAVSLKHSRNVDFWACDATALPFAENQCDAAFSMNLLDCVHSPLEFLMSMSSILKTDAVAVISTPYDWSSSATAMEGWLGGHSQRGPDAGASEPLLRHLLSPGHPQSLQSLRLVAEDNCRWQVRLHDRSVVSYDSHLVVARKC